MPHAFSHTQCLQLPLTTQHAIATCSVLLDQVTPIKWQKCIELIAKLLESVIQPSTMSNSKASLSAIVCSMKLIDIRFIAIRWFRPLCIWVPLSCVIWKKLWCTQLNWYNWGLNEPHSCEAYSECVCLYTCIDRTFCRNFLYILALPKWLPLTPTWINHRDKLQSIS